MSTALTLLVLAALASPDEAERPSTLLLHAAGADEKDAGKGATLTGPDSRIQISVTATYGDGRLRDWTSKVTYTATPTGVVEIDTQGRVTPKGNGRAEVVAKGAGGLSAKTTLTVERFDTPPAINFANQVTPIFTKLGCNSGGCHGKSGGQNGFPLSLLGFEPKEDYEYLVQEAFGRRLFPTAPGHSLVLLKATGEVPHGGGGRLKKDGHDYRLIVRWLRQGMPYGKPEDPTVSSIEVYPRRRLLSANEKQQLRVVATYSDGHIEDVSHAARYEPNDKRMARVDTWGLVSLMDQPGDAAIMIRYQDRVAVFEATVPLGVEIKTLPAARNFIDERVFEKLKRLGLPPSPVCDDMTFLRRVTLDVAGRLPTLEEASAFLEEKAGDRRDRVINRLVDSPDYADFFANKWSSILRNKRTKDTYTSGNFAFYEWIRDSLGKNRGYDRFVTELLTATGEISHNPAVAWYRQVSKEGEQVEDVAQLFLGVRIQCARCHHHPFEKWSQQDYYGLAAFFSTLEKKAGAGPDESTLFHKRGTAQSKNPKTGLNVKPTGLGSPPEEIAPEQDPRAALAGWMTRKDNRFFARALVNRYWKHFFGRGIVDPEDDMRKTNPPSNAELLDSLESEFIKNGYNLKWLVRTICRSNAYQLSALPNKHNGSDRQSFSRFTPRRLSAEVLLDAIDQFNTTTTTFKGLPPGIRAVQIPDHGGVNSYFLTVFGRPAGASACECERSGDASLAQSLHLLNSKDIHSKTNSGIARTLAADAKKDDRTKIAELYLRAFSRMPDKDEFKIALGHVNKFEKKERVKAYEDIVWALINTKEFLFNH